LATTAANGTALRNGHSPVMAFSPMLYRKRSLAVHWLGSQQGVRRTVELRWISWR